MIICSPVTDVNPKVSAIAEGTVTEITAKDLKSATTIHEGAFTGSSQLTSVVVPESCNVINSKAFVDCSALSKIILKGDAVKTLVNADALDGTLLQCGTVWNYAPKSPYCFGTNTTVFDEDERGYGEPNPHEFYTYDNANNAVPKICGKLTNGCIYKPGDAYGIHCIEFWYTVVATGYCYIWFKLPKRMTVTQVNAHFCNSSSQGRRLRGFPTESNYSVWVTDNASNVEENNGKLTNLTPSTSHPMGADFREYISTGNIAGQYVFLQVYIDGSSEVYVHALSQVQIWCKDIELPSDAGIFIDSSDPDMVNRYKTATNWNAYSDIIKPITALGV